LDSFDDRYLGTKTSDPTVDNDGNALAAGALYFSTTQNVMKVYDGASWIAATAAGATSLVRFRYVATSGQTTFSGADAASATLTYTVNNTVVMRNGVTLDTSEYTASSGTSVVLNVAAGTGDIIDIIAFKSFTVSDALSATSGGTVNGAVTITGTLIANSNVGIGVTPSGWSGGYVGLQVRNASLASYTSGAYTWVGSNWYNSSGNKYIGTGFATLYEQTDGKHAWLTAASGTAGNAISFTEAMTLTAAGNLGLGITPSVGGAAANYKLFQVGSGGGSSIYSGSGQTLFCTNVAWSIGTPNYQASSIAPLMYSQESGTHIWKYAAAGTAGNAITFSEAARIDSSGNLLVGITSYSSRFVVANSSASPMVYVGPASLGTTGGESSANAMMKFRGDSSTSRSINAAGTINASGADYAEYMTKAGSFTVAKGDVVGINAQGKLTNIFADAVSFVVKSTDPSYVGGDTWGSEEALGLTTPELPTQNQATEEAVAETDEAFAVRQAQYEADITAFESALEAARQTVDRIAFSGQVPVNVTGATAGQYIIPVSNNGAIKGQAISNPTFEQYQSAVGKVIAIEADGRARIIVKVA
jgi:hypothetical protein